MNQKFCNCHNGQIKKIRRRIDGTQAAVNIKVIAAKRHLELASQHDLKNISALAMFLTFCHHAHVFFVRHVRRLVSGGFKFIGSKIPAHEQRFDARNVALFACCKIFQYFQTVVKMIYGNDVFVETVLNFGNGTFRIWS